MALAVQTGIPPSVWADEGAEAIATAVELLNKDGGRKTAGPGGPQMAG